MTFDDEMCQFVQQHQADDTTRLLLSASRYPHIDVPYAVEQIEARRRLRIKLPTWYALPQLVMGGRVPAEQCSSELTALFKRSIMLADARSLCDMTGGMGVDFWFMSRGLRLAIYTERQSLLCQHARHNFSVLQAAYPAPTGDCDIIVREGLSTELDIPDVDVIYLDPARRSESGARIYEISDCEPDVVQWQAELLEHCRQLITKVSPMADITRTLTRLTGVTDVYVVSVRNECKELLFVQQPEGNDVQDFRESHVHCVDLMPDREVRFSYRLSDVSALPSPQLACEVGAYFYEPCASVMKAQPFAVIADRYGVEMLDADCHYFTSRQLVAGFPGRTFVVDEVIPFASRQLKRLRDKIPQANLATRSFPLSADQLRQRTGIRDGGDVYVFGASLHAVGSVLIKCHKG